MEKTRIYIVLAMVLSVFIIISLGIAYACTSNSDCSGSTSYCDTGYSGECKPCGAASDCGSNECLTYTCDSIYTTSTPTFTCASANKADGASCATGRCCAGTCANITGNLDFYPDCRSGPACSGTNWQYSIAHQDQICNSSECRVCNNGLCNQDLNAECGTGETCVAGVCTSTGCTRDSNCSTATPYCNTSTGVCMKCKLDTHCEDNDNCRILNRCVAGSCTFPQDADGKECGADGYCCKGRCKTSTDNEDFHEDCRSGPECSGSSFEYVAENDGEKCGGFECRVCKSGFCTFDNNTLCGKNSLCKQGRCTDSICGKNTDCPRDRPLCDMKTGKCIACFQDIECDDFNDCTLDRCINSTCKHNYTEDFKVCSKGKCCKGDCFNVSRLAREGCNPCDLCTISQSCVNATCVTNTSLSSNEKEQTGVDDASALDATKDKKKAGGLINTILNVGIVILIVGLVLIGAFILYIRSGAASGKRRASLRKDAQREEKRSEPVSTRGSQEIYRSPKDKAKADQRETADILGSMDTQLEEIRINSYIVEATASHQGFDKIREKLVKDGRPSELVDKLIQKFKERETPRKRDG